jgi:hypothetical protein
MRRKLLLKAISNISGHRAVNPADAGMYVTLVECASLGQGLKQKIDKFSIIQLAKSSLWPLCLAKTPSAVWVPEILSAFFRKFCPI